MTHYCENPSCENEIGDYPDVVPVSYGLEMDQVKMRRLCFTCAEAYHSGAQHGRFRAMRRLAEERDRLDAKGFPVQALVVVEMYIGLLDNSDDPAEGSGEVAWEHVYETEDGEE